MDRESFEKRKKVINDLIHDKFYTPMKAKEIAMLLNIPKEDRPDLQKVLDALVLEGKIGVTIGNRTFELSEGDSVYFNPEIPHGQYAVEGTAKFLTIIDKE
ncbi:MAG: cupin domain-containing protein [Bacteroides sp.]|nr:cupin domain-containing protein [Bacteroides sp.]